MPDGVAPTALYEQSERFAALDQHAQNLLNAVTLHSQLARDGIDERLAVRAQERRRARSPAAQSFCAEDSVEQLIGETATNLMIAGESSPVVLGERTRVEINGFDTDPVSHGRAPAA